MEAAADPAPLAPKEDPETLVLRGRPRPVVRFRRGLVIGATAAVCASLVAVTWLALEPPSFRLVSDRETAEPSSKAAPDVLAQAPKGYGDVPLLGPPLPGDLGRPILEHQRRVKGEPSYGNPAASAAERARAAAEADRQRLAAAREAARASAVIVQLSGSGRAEGRREGAGPDGLAPIVDDVPAAAPSAAAGDQQRKLDFTRSSQGGVSSHRLMPPSSPWTLSAGTIIAATLMTGLNSDLPGLVLAQVSEPVRDSVTGQTVLIPQGSRLIGSYDSIVAYGQRRALLVWQRIVLPDGSSIELDNVPATDAAGYAGVEDRVDFHTWRLLRGIALSTLLGVGTELGIDGESDLVRAVRESTQQNAARAGDRITARNLDVQPTLTVRPGWPLRAVIHKDLVLRPWKD